MGVNENYYYVFERGDGCGKYSSLIAVSEAFTSKEKKELLSIAYENNIFVGTLEMPDMDLGVEFLNLRFDFTPYGSLTYPRRDTLSSMCGLIDRIKINRDYDLNDIDSGTCNGAEKIFLSDYLVDIDPERLDKIKDDFLWSIFDYERVTGHVYLLSDLDSDSIRDKYSFILLSMRDDLASCESDLIEYGIVSDKSSYLIEKVGSIENVYRRSLGSIQFFTGEMDPLRIEACLC